MSNPVQRAAAAVESADGKGAGLSKLARFLGVTRQRIQQYKKRGWLPVEHARLLARKFPHLSVEELTGGRTSG